MVAKSIAKIYTNIHKPTDYQRDYWESSCGQTWTKWLQMYRTALFS